MQHKPIALLAALAFAAPLWSQVNSDYFAYPSTYANPERFMRDSRQLTFARMPGLATDYRIGAGDVLLIEIIDVADMDHRATVDNRGFIRLAAIGDVKVEGMTAEELELFLGAELKKKKLIREPEVLVHILDYFAKPYYVVGQVDRPGEYTMTQAVTLMDALFISGGIDATAGGMAYLHRHVADGASPGGAKPNEDALLRHPELPLPGTKVIPFALADLKKGGILENNPVLQRGDVVVVPRRSTDVFYVVGDVTNPGTYEIVENEDMSIGQAIAQAGGPLKTAKQNKAVLIRQAENGTQVNIPIDFKGVLLGRADDVTLHRNDVIFIPGSGSKTIGYGILGSIPGTAQRSVNNTTRIGQ